MVEQADIRVCARADGRVMIIEGHHVLRAAVWRRLPDRHPDAHLIEADSGEQAAAPAFARLFRPVSLDVTK